MKVSVSWLKEWIKEIPTDLSARLTMAGLEVEGEELAAPYFTKVVVGQIMSLESHPDANKLNIAQVDIGGKEFLQIVCGAPNVAVGIKVPVAIIGSILPGDFAIKATKLRGIESNGMLCSARELGLSEDHSGLMILSDEFAVGSDFRKLYDLDDKIFEVDLTPNRGDCLSLIGIARDIAAITGQTLCQEEQKKFPSNIDDVKQITVEDKIGAPLYLGRIIKNLNPNAKTPLWMSERLRRCGIRPHGILVNITNYVLLELGQPLHAFDLTKLSGDITVRSAEEGEPLTLINENKIQLKRNNLVIADEKEVIALAGIMGGLNSACDDDTTEIFLESAWFDPVTIAGKARIYGLHSDAAHRFERGVDFTLPYEAMERASELFTELAGGSLGPVIEVINEANLPKRSPIEIRFARVDQLIGKNYAKDDVITMLSRIGKVEDISDEKLQFTAPSYRFDLQIEEDLIEEIARIDGYDNIPVLDENNAYFRMKLVKESEVSLRDFNNILVSRGYHETITMSFTSPKWQSTLAPNEKPIVLKNPISNELSVMRTTLLTGILGVIEHNLKRQQSRLRFFESGLTYRGTLDHLVQERCLSGAICGDNVDSQWGIPSRKVDFFDLKGDVEALLNRTGLTDYHFTSAKIEILHPGQSAEIQNSKGELIGYLGKLHPTISSLLDLNTEIFVFELYFDLLKRSITPAFAEISKFPTSKRDLSLVVPNNIQVDKIINSMLINNSGLLYNVKLFDVYEAENGQSKEMKYISFSLTFQSYKENLKDSEIDTIIDNILKDLSLMNIELRK